ncbi:MAG TPA: aspartate aminotransferase [Lachnospiraceae bacterium]|nr:aspartate aminotransferase [Lachnospiraceae bacterium]
MKMRFAERMNHVSKSFIREILKVTDRPEVISFAGGLPNPKFFPKKEIAEATQKVIETNGDKALQYSTTEGYAPLREYIYNRYYKNIPNVTLDNILITNGSQQALDLISKVFIEEGDCVLVEKPGYLGAIQCFSVFMPEIRQVELCEDGINLEELEEMLTKYNPKLFYCVPSFQNPTGLTYSEENRKKLAEIMKKTDTILIEDNPYGELRFEGKDCSIIKTYLGDQAISLGSFSKVFTPGMRLGWLCCSNEILDKVITCKQASDLHTNIFSQVILAQYLEDNDMDAHIQEIRDAYGMQKECMVNAMKKYFPAEVKFTNPEGGMFLWLTLPEGVSSLDLLSEAGEKNVAFVPGNPFYVNVDKINTCRLNYTASEPEEIEEGIKRLAEVIKHNL